MLACERRWVAAVLGSFADPATRPVSERSCELDYLGTFLGLMASAPLPARVGLRAALWLAMFSPLWLTGRLRLLTQLGLYERQELLESLAVHPRFLVREATLLLKLAACLTLFADAGVRESSRYDGRARGATAIRLTRSSR